MDGDNPGRAPAPGRVRREGIGPADVPAEGAQRATVAHLRPCRIGDHGSTSGSSGLRHAVER